MVQVSKKIIGTIVIVLCIALVLSTKFPVFHSVRMLMVQVSMPVLGLSNKTLIVLRDLKSAFVLNAELKRENSALKNQTLFLQSKINVLREYEIENRRLRALLEFKENIEYDTIPAKVIGRDLTGWSQIIIIDKGTRHNISIDMSVVSGDGVVGKIIETGYFASKVLLLIDKQSRIGAIMQKSRVVGVIEGTGKPYLIMNYLPREGDFFIDDMALSSGLGKVYEKGLVIGQIKAVHEEKFGLYKYAEVVPAVNFNKLEEVLVILKTNAEFKKNEAGIYNLE